MAWLGEPWRRLGLLLRPTQLDRDLKEEMRLHLDLKTQKLIEAGVEPEEACYRAQRQFGNALLLRETSGEIWGWGSIDRLWQDLRYALRVLRKSPSFTVAAILTLALGIGVNSSIFSLIHNLLLQTMPVRDPSTVALVFNKHPRFSGAMWCSYPDYVDFRDKSQVFAGLVAVKRDDPYLDDTGRRVLADFVSGNYLTVLGTGPTLPDEPVAVISNRFWRRHFNSDPNVTGKTVALNGRRYAVIAVAPLDFGGITIPPPDVWVPLIPATKTFDYRPDDRQGHWLAVAGRLKSGVTLEQAQAEMTVLSRRLELQYPATNNGFSVVISPASYINPRTRGNVVPVIALLMGAVSLVLLIVCANLANLLLARAINRQKEIGLRLSLGASRGRVIRQLLTESTLLALAGGAAGLVLTAWIPKIVFSAATRPDLALYDYNFELPLGSAVLIYSLLLSLVTGAIFGLAPAIQFSRPDLSSALKDYGAFGANVSRSRIRNTMVAGQVAFSLVLLIVSGLFVRSVLRASLIDAGFNTKDLLAVSFDPRSRGYSDMQADEFYRHLLERAKNVPQVRATSLVRSLPLGDDISLTRFEIEGQAVDVAFNVVSADYFRLLGVPTLIGRSLESGDTSGSPPVVMINESAARQFWAGQNPIGKHLREGKPGTDFQVIGVVKDFRDFHIATAPQPYIYIPKGQASRFQSLYGHRISLLIRTKGDVGTAVGALRNEAAALDRKLYVNVSTIDQVVALSMWPARVSAGISGAIGLLALMLASVGIYGSIAYIVSQRTREMGIRIALGAQRAEVVALVLKQALRVVSVGAVIGFAGGIAVSRVLGDMLYGLISFDVPTFVLVPMFLVTVAMLATYIPARRAAKVDPMEALRYE
jgi:predicted permease